MAEVKRLESGGVMISTSPTDSYILDEEEVDAVVGAFNNRMTSSKQEPNNGLTTEEQRPAISTTTAERDFKAQTASALDAKQNLPIDTPEQVLKKNKALVALLSDKRFIKANSPYGNRGLPYYFSVPPKFVDAVNTELRTNYNKTMIAKVEFCRKYQERFSPVFVKFLCVIWFCSLLLVGWWFGFRGDNSVDLNPVSAEQKENFDFRKEVERWQTKNHYYFSGWRLSHEIRNCKATSLQELDKYLNNQRTIQGASFTELQKW